MAVLVSDWRGEKLPRVTATASVRSRGGQSFPKVLAMAIDGSSFTGVREGMGAAAYAISVVRVVDTVLQRACWAGQEVF